MKKFDTLYKRTKTGAIQQWTIEVVTKTSHGNPVIKKQAGQLNGQLITHNEVISEGKNIGRANETTPLEQALFQAESDWKRKKDNGYKSLTDLAIIVTFDSDDPNCEIYQWYEGDKFKASLNIEGALEYSVPKFNSDASGNLLPQLAPSKLWQYGSKKNKYPTLGEFKFDGNRTTIVMGLESTYALTRTGKPQGYLQHLIAVLDIVFPIQNRTETIILDGEVYLHGLPLEEINEAIKKMNENTAKLQFHVYDLPLIDAVQEVRSDLVARLVAEIDHQYFQHTPPVIINSDDEAQKFLDKCIELDYEGAMFKDPKGTYQPGQRSSFWQKAKITEDNEYKIVGYCFGQRGAQDLKFVCEHEGNEFEVTMNGTVESKQRLADKVDSLVGKLLTVKHKGFTKYGIPNHAKGKAIRDHE